MSKSTITIEVETDDKKIPDNIVWKATDAVGDKPQRSKAMMLAFWDADEKTALRIDLWTKTMMIMADTYGRATNHADMVDDMKKFAHGFYHKFREKQLKENKA